VTVCNSARAVERSVDKSMTSLLLHRAGIPTPPTWVTENAEAARDVLTNAFAQGHRIVSKPLFGSQGKGLLRLAPGDALPPSESCNGLYYLQRFVETAADATGDWRVFVIGDEAVAAMRRRGTDWIHNVSRGGKTEAARLEPDLCDLAVRATRAVGADYAGVDLIRDGNGAATVLEVNGIPAWQGLQSVTTIDIADRLVRYLVDVHRAQRSSASGPAGKLK
ncbi:MAG: RimK family alpha-L-glutamate ligase, partial [Burkholderiales bacterium]|nr:RimK family alpha-L-glutamate ligase [Burkholderiales bacterium]